MNLVSKTALALALAALVGCDSEQAPPAEGLPVVEPSPSPSAKPSPSPSPSPSAKPSPSPSVKPSPSPSPSKSPVGSLKYETSFEESTSLGYPVFQAAEMNPGRIVRSTDESRTGRYAVKVMLSKDEPLVAGSKRNELKPAEGSLAPMSERRYELSIFLPHSFVVDPTPESIFQWHNVPNFKQGEDWGLRTSDGGVRQTPLHVQTVNGRWVMVHCLSSVPSDFRSPVRCRRTDLGAYQTGVWTDFVVHARFTYRSDGFLDVWKNGQLVHSVRGQTYYNDESGPYMKFGIYKWAWAGASESTTTSRTIYFDDLRATDPSAD